MSPEPAPPPATRPLRDRLLDWIEQRVNLSELFSFLTHFGLVTVPLDTRRPLRELLSDLDRMPVPQYARGPQVLGVLTAVLFGLEAFTGLLLAFYYRPTPDAAYSSTLSIVRDLPFGGLIHQVHAWGATLLIAVVAARVLRLFWDGLYKAPRELLWVAAVGLVWVALQFDFTGRLLGWDSAGYWSTVRGLEVVYALPLVGPLLAFFLGGRVMGEDVLTRFYVLHVGVLPLFWAAFTYFTFATVRKVGLGHSHKLAQAGATTTFRHHRYDMTLLTLFLFAILVTLAVLVPFRFGGLADPYVTPAGARPPWYMHAAYAAVQGTRIPAWLPGDLMLLLAFGLVTLPWWARRVVQRFPESRLRLAGIVILVAWIALTVFGAFVERP